jgi:hypothetical protein
MWRFRLSDEDREKYGGPEWVDYRLTKAVDLDTELLEQIEDATGYTILVTLPVALESGSAKATRAAIWLARHIAGVHEPPFHAFKPKILACDFEQVVEDADPPDEPPNRAARRALKAAPKPTRKQTVPRSGT